MEFIPQFLTLFGLLLFVLTYSFRKNNERKVTNLVAPEPSGALPFIGHLHRLRGQAPVARILGKMADEYGPVYSLRLGSHRALVVSSWQMVKECFTANDRNFATRPNMAVSRYMGYDSAVFALAPYGPYWLEIRKLVMLELLTSQRLEKLKNVRNSEVEYFIKELSLLSPEDGDQTSMVNMTKWFEHITFNIIVRMLAGKRFSSGSGIEGNNEDLQVKEAIKKGLYLSGVFVVSDVIPNLEWMDIGGHVKAMKQAAKELDSVLGKWLDEHVEKSKECNSNKEADFMDVMLSTLVAWYMIQVVIIFPRRKEWINSKFLAILFAHLGVLVVVQFHSKVGMGGYQRVCESFCCKLQNLILSSERCLTNIFRG